MQLCCCLISKFIEILKSKRYPSLHSLASPGGRTTPHDVYGSSQPREHYRYTKPLPLPTQYQLRAPAPGLGSHQYCMLAMDQGEALSLSLPNRLRPHLAGAACAPTRIYCVTLAISAAMVGHRGSRGTALHSETWVTVWRSSCSSINLYSLKNGSSTKTQQYKHKYKENVSKD